MLSIWNPCQKVALAPEENLDCSELCQSNVIVGGNLVATSHTNLETYAPHQPFMWWHPMISLLALEQILHDLCDLQGLRRRENGLQTKSSLADASSTSSGNGSIRGCEQHAGAY